MRAFTFGREMCPLPMLEFFGRRRIRMRVLMILLGWNEIDTEIEQENGDRAE